MKPSERPYIFQVLSHPFLRKFNAFEIGAAVFAAARVSANSQDDDVVEDRPRSTASLPCTLPSRNDQYMAQVSLLQERSYSS